MARAENDALGRNPDIEYATRLAHIYVSVFPQADLDATEVSLRIYAAYDAQVQAVERMLASAGPVRTLARYRVLRCLLFSEQESKTQVEIMTELGVTSANVTRLVDGLEESGLVTRHPHPTDRRVTYVKLTTAGREVASRLATAMIKIMDEMCRGFSPREKEVFRALLVKFQKNADDSPASGERRDQPSRSGQLSSAPIVEAGQAKRFG